MTTSRGIRRLAIAIAATLAAFAVALASLSWLVDHAAVREAVRAQVRNATGLEVQIAGDTRVSVFPTSSVAFTDVGVATAGGKIPALRMDRLIVRLRLLPLFFNRYEVADLTLERPVISVTRDARGGNNWSALTDTLAQTTPAGTAETIPFSEIRIEDGVLSYRDDTRGTFETLQDIDMSLAWPAISRSFAATGQMTWRDQRLDASFGLTDFAAALSGKRSGLKVRVAGAPLKFAFDGAMAGGVNLALDGTLTADSPSLRQALRWSGQDIEGAAGLGRFALKGTATVKNATIAITNANVELDGNAAEGVLSFSIDGRQTLQATLDAGAIDVTPYVKSLRLLSAGAREWERQPLDLRWLSSIDLDMRLSATGVTAGATRLGRTALAANIRNGSMTVSIGEGQMYGGIVKGSFDIARANNDVTMRGQFQFNDVDLEACAGELFGFRKLAGRGNMSLMLEATGTNAFALAQSIDGSATLNGRDGALLGFNVEQLLRRLERRPLSGVGDYRSGKTPFDRLTIALRLKDGIATTENVSIEGPSVKLSIAGATSIPAREFDLKGIAALLPGAGAPPSFELPFLLQGPWDDPLLFPDSEALIRRSPAGGSLLDALKNRGAREAVQSAIERLSGASRPAAAPPPEPPAPPPAPPPAADIPAPAQDVPTGAAAQPETEGPGAVPN